MYWALSMELSRIHWPVAVLPIMMLVLWSVISFSPA